MGTPCEINSILKLKPSQNYPKRLVVGELHQAKKDGYRIVPLDVPISLVDQDWVAHADVIVEKLTWHERTTHIDFRVSRVYKTSFSLKE